MSHLEILKSERRQSPQANHKLTAKTGIEPRRPNSSPGLFSSPWVPISDFLDHCGLQTDPTWLWSLLMNLFERDSIPIRMCRSYRVESCDPAVVCPGQHRPPHDGLAAWPWSFPSYWNWLVVTLRGCHLVPGCASHWRCGLSLSSYWQEVGQSDPFWFGVALNIREGLCLFVFHFSFWEN